MIVVIQCAATKRPDAGRFMSADGRPIVFVAHPELAPVSASCVYGRPDDSAGNGRTWRDHLLAYDATDGNPLRLLPAYRLYENPVYGHLADQCGLGNLYILSAGWGLIGARFLTPYYDITFSQSAEPYKRRRREDRYQDFRLLPNETNEPIVFFGAKDYVPMFCALTAGVNSERTVFYNSSRAPEAPGCRLERFVTATRTNWHYECAHRFALSIVAKR
jgi:hypothetical protein